MFDWNHDKVFSILVPQGAIIVNYIGWAAGVLSIEMAFMSMFVLTTCMISHIALNTKETSEFIGITTSNDNIEYERL